MQIHKVGVVGGGLMGSGIAEVAARAGLEVTIVEANKQAASLTMSKIEASLDRAVARGRLQPDDRVAVGKRIVSSTKLTSLSNCQLVIEAIVENEKAKLELFKQLDDIVGPEALLASNTSSIPITRLGRATGRPDKVVGIHFFNPVPVLNLVEVVASIETSDETVEVARSFAAVQLGKNVIHSPDRAGFIVNALLVPFILSAVRMFEAGFATKEDIDEGMVSGCAHPLGPLALADLIGLDTAKSIAECLYQEFKDPSLATPPLLARMVEANNLGRKTGKGFYDYSSTS